MKFLTSLLSGAGNTFHILDDSAVQLELSDKKKFALQICAAFPADGFVYLRQIKDYLFKWDFYNNDGSEAEMCGNAARCVGFYIKNIMHKKETVFHLQTKAGLLKITALDQTSYLVQTSAAEFLEHKKYFFCNTGVPHVVVSIENKLDFKDFKEFCRTLRHHPDFQPSGTNVTLVKESSHLKIEAVTFERGVEDFTLACGTGALAVGLFYKKKFNKLKTVVEMPGGQLMIDMSNSEYPLMSGPAIFIRSCSYESK